MTGELRAEAISYGYVAGRNVLDSASLFVGAGEVLFVLGANGSGKTTLLDCLAGIRVPDSGCILVDELRLDRLAPGERARRIGLVPQLHEPVFDYTVEEIVTMGRAPHVGTFARPSAKDRAVVLEAMDSVGVMHLRRTRYTRISGGERQVVLIARGLAQGAGCLLMDEPAAHLDPRHQQDVFRAVRQLAREDKAFIISSHQPNHAIAHADRAALLVRGHIDVCGRPEDVLTPDTLRATYAIDFVVVSERGLRAIMPWSATPNSR